MADISKITETAMILLTYSGMAKSCYMEAMALAKQGKFEEADAKITVGDGYFVEAHHGHGELLQEEMSTEESQASLLMTHAEDQLMGAESLKIVILELIDIYKKLEAN